VWNGPGPGNRRGNSPCRPHFRSVHLQLDELVGIARQYVDDVAERAAAIGVWPTERRTPSRKPLIEIARELEKQHWMWQAQQA
jgi:DNA-binding ferritin-like protein